MRRYNGLGNEEDDAYAIAVDNAGNTYVTGRSRGSLTDYDYATIKYYPNGDTAWVRRYDGPVSSRDCASAMAIDSSGNVYVTGSSIDNMTYVDYVTIKYYPNGDTAWVRSYNGTGNGEDDPYAIAVDHAGNTYVTGRSYGITTNYDYATIKYYPNGDAAWVRRYDGPSAYDDYAHAIAIDSSGNVYVTGWITTNEGPYDYATIRYDPNGNPEWLRRYNGSRNRSSEAYAIAVDYSSNVYVTGRSQGNEGSVNYDYATIKYFQALRGDVNKDWVIDIEDVVYLINYLYKGSPSPAYLIVGDCNCDSVVDVEDVVFLINYLFKGGAAPDC